MRRIAGALRLPGPAADQPAAGTFYALLWGLQLLFTIHAGLGMLLTIRNQPFQERFVFVVFVNALLVLTPGTCLILLRRGLLRPAGTVYLAGVWLAYTLIILFNGGIHHVGLAVYIALPVSAAWLFGYRPALWTAAACLGSATTMAVLETIGVGPLHYFQGLPSGIWLLLLECTLMGVVPVATVLSSLQRALAQSRVVETELQEYRHHLEDLVQQRTAELVEARDQAERASRAKTAFLANMSHELRTPLNAILGFSAIVRTDGGLSDQHRKDLEIVGNSGEHLLSLIDDILDTAKIETGGVSAESVAFGLHALVNDAVNMMRERARAKNLELTLDLSSNAPWCVRSDPGKLRQVLANLIGNAVKYTDKGSVVVRLDARPADGSGQVVLVFDVEDTGIGIAPQDQPRIFDPFVQAGRRPRQGVGLGLAICRNFVQVLGGTIQVESQPGRGTRFHVEVPAETADPSELLAETLHGEQVTGLEPGQPEYRILIVEDQQENWLLLDRLLRAAGFQVRGAEDGLQAVEAFRVWRPHFIWMDLHLPGLGGLEAAKRIRELEGGSEVKIVAVTASAFASEREQVLAAGLDDFLRKPYRPREIFECMSRHLGVRYLYEAIPQTDAADPHVTMRPEDLASLPPEQFEELEQAVVCLDWERIARIVRQISDQNASLGGVLTRLADRFAYTPIFKAIESSRRRTAQTSH